MILPIISDIGCGSPRGQNHIKTDTSKFRLGAFWPRDNNIVIEDYDITTKEFKQIKQDFKLLWG